MVAPLSVAVVAIPILISGMGKERFGLLSIIWMGVGYFSIFDMGLGRALTKLIAERLGQHKTADLSEVIWTALWLTLGTGLLGMAIGILVAGPIIGHLFKVSEGLKAEGVFSFQLLACSVPIVIITSALIGILEAHQRFATIATIRIPLGVMTFLGPLASLQFTPSLVGATGVLAVTRALALVSFYVVATHPEPALKHPVGIVGRHIRPLFNFGGWLTITNIISPLMVYFDRFFLGAFLSLTAVTYYVTPYDMLSRVQYLPQAMMGVLFPALTIAIEGDRSRLPGLYNRASRGILFLMLPLMSAVFLFAPELLRLWLGQDFATQSTPVVRWVALGLITNTIARSAFTVLQSVGRPDLVAKVHAIEVMPYAVVLWYLTQQFGISGTAAAWFLRVLVDAVVLNELVRKRLLDLASGVRWTYMATGCVIVSFLLAWLVEPVFSRLVLLIASATISAWFLSGLLDIRLTTAIRPWRRP